MRVLDRRARRAGPPPMGRVISAQEARIRRDLRELGRRLTAAFGPFIQGLEELARAHMARRAAAVRALEGLGMASGRTHPLTLADELARWPLRSGIPATLPRADRWRT